MVGDDANKPQTGTDLKMLKHDVKNQLSGIQLALEGLRYEVEDLDGDFQLYLDSIAESAMKIDKLLNDF